MDTSDESEDRERAAALSEAINFMWAKFLPEIRARAQVLEDAARSAAGGNLGEPAREAAQAAAHKLAGTLGTFGLARGTKLARQLEQMYTRPQSLDSATVEHLAALAAEVAAIIESRTPSP